MYIYNFYIKFFVKFLLKMTEFDHFCLDVLENHKYLELANYLTDMNFFLRLIDLIPEATKEESLTLILKLISYWYLNFKDNISPDVHSKILHLFFETFPSNFPNLSEKSRYYYLKTFNHICFCVFPNILENCFDRIVQMNDDILFGFCSIFGTETALLSPLRISLFSAFKPIFIQSGKAATIINFVLDRINQRPSEVSQFLSGVSNWFDINFFINSDLLNSLFQALDHPLCTANIIRTFNNIVFRLTMDDNTRLIVIQKVGNIELLSSIISKTSNLDNYNEIFESVSTFCANIGCILMNEEYFQFALNIVQSNQIGLISCFHFILSYISKLSDSEVEYDFNQLFMHFFKMLNDFFGNSDLTVGSYADDLYLKCICHILSTLVCNVIDKRNTTLLFINNLFESMREELNVVKNPQLCSALLQLILHIVHNEEKNKANLRKVINFNKTIQIYIQHFSEIIQITGDVGNTYIILYDIYIRICSKFTDKFQEEYRLQVLNSLVSLFTSGHSIDFISANFYHLNKFENTSIDSEFVYNLAFTGNYHLTKMAGDLIDNCREKDELIQRLFGDFSRLLETMTDSNKTNTLISVFKFVESYNKQKQKFRQLYLDILFKARASFDNDDIAMSHFIPALYNISNLERSSENDFFSEIYKHFDCINGIESIRSLSNSLKALLHNLYHATPESDSFLFKVYLDFIRLCVPKLVYFYTSSVCLEKPIDPSLTDSLSNIKEILGHLRAEFTCVMDCMKQILDIVQVFIRICYLNMSNDVKFNTTFFSFLVVFLKFFEDDFPQELSDLIFSLFKSCPFSFGFLSSIALNDRSSSNLMKSFSQFYKKLLEYNEEKTINALADIKKFNIDHEELRNLLLNDDKFPKASEYIFKLNLCLRSSSI